MGRYVQRINPKRPINSAAQAVHGISSAMLVGCPTWEEIAKDVFKILRDSNCLIAHNFGFDGPFIFGELLRVGLPVPSTDSYCTMENGRWATFNGKSPKLEELCEALGVNYDGAAAHAADYDTEVLAQCFLKGLDRGAFELPAG